MKKNSLCIAAALFGLAHACFIFAEGAQVVSTDYYLPATHFGNGYQVSLPQPVQCNPVTAPDHCQIKN